MLFSIDKKTGFICKNKVSVYLIHKDKQIPFYFFESDGYFKFNLPKGKYIISSEFIQKTSPVFHELKKYKVEKNKFKGIFPKIIIKDYEGKAGIDINKNIMLISPYLLKKPIYTLMFILLHEMGHYYFFSEHKCDNFAKNKMLEMGFNPSQIAKGINEALSSKNALRKIQIVKQFKCKIK